MDFIPIIWEIFSQPDFVTHQPKIAFMFIYVCILNKPPKPKISLFRSKNQVFVQSKPHNKWTIQHHKDQPIGKPSKHDKIVLPKFVYWNLCIGIYV